MADEFGGQLVGLLPRLRRFACALTGNRETADELVQIACEKALSRQASFKPGTRLDAWVFVILRNAWYDRLRRMRREGIAEDLDSYTELADGTQSNQADDRLTLNRVMKAVGELPPDQREVLILICIEEFSYREAAEMLAVPIGTVMSRLARARLKISQTVGIDCPQKR